MGVMLNIIPAGGKQSINDCSLDGIDDLFFFFNGTPK